MFSANPLMGGFVGLGEVLAQDASNFFHINQGVSTPNSRPVSSPGFSFNFGEAFSSLTKPIANFFDPVQQAKNSTVAATGAAAANIIRTGGAVASSLISTASKRLTDALSGQNNKTTPNVTLIPTVQNPQPQSGSTLGDILSLLTASTGTVKAETRLNTDVATSAANFTQNNVLLIGGALILGAFLLASNKKGSR